MFKEIPDLLNAAEVAALRRIAATAKFVDGRISNPHSKVKNNLQLHEPQAHQEAGKIILQAMQSHEDFNNSPCPWQSLRR